MNMMVYAKAVVVNVVCIYIAITIICILIHMTHRMTINVLFYDGLNHTGYQSNMMVDI